jgi:hypothetical protein
VTGRVSLSLCWKTILRRRVRGIGQVSSTILFSNRSEWGLLSAFEQRDKLDAIVAEGNRRYGQAELEPRGIIHWSAGRTSALTISDDFGLRLKHRELICALTDRHAVCGSIDWRLNCGAPKCNGERLRGAVFAGPSFP